MTASYRMHDSRPALHFRIMATMATRAWLAPGNHVEVQLNGDGTYPRLWEDLRSATQSITLQLYTRTNVFAFVAHRVGDRWQCASAHNSDVVLHMETNTVDDEGALRAANYQNGHVS